MKTRRLPYLWLLAMVLLALAPAVAGSLEPPPGPVSATRPPDRCFDIVNRFVDCGNGAVKDTKTGLFWLKNAYCFGVQNWATANISAAGLGHGQCGLTDGSLPGDWRLPTLNCTSPNGVCDPIDTATGEFVSIFNFAVCNAPPYVLNANGTGCWTAATSPFSGVQSHYAYWSSTTHATISSGAFFAILVDVDGFDRAASAGKYETQGVWPVRDGP